MHFILSENDKPNTIDLDSSICDDKHFMTAAHFRFECETLKIKIDGILLSVFNFQNRTVISSGNE